MKIIKITESQYKRLVRNKNLNEQIIYPSVDIERQERHDITTDLKFYIEWLNDTLMYLHSLPLYIDKIESGVVYINWDKYSEEEKNLIKKYNKEWVDHTIDTKDSVSDKGYYSSGLDWDFEDEPEYVYNPEDWPDEKEDDVVIEPEKEDDVVVIEPEKEDDDEVIAFTVPITSDQREGRFLKNQKNESVDPKYIYDFLIRKGLKDYQACGILGCIFYESYYDGKSFNTGVLGDYDEDKGGYTSMGICQWHNERFENLIDYSIEKNKSVTNKDLQLDFMWDELNDTYFNKNVLVPIKNSSGISEVTFIWACKYEACQKCCTHDSESVSKRLKKAEEYFELYSSGGEDVVIDSDKINILVIGDSQSAGSSGKYHHKLDKDKYSVKNTAEESAKTSKMLSTLEEYEEDLSKYDVVIIFGGGNDGCPRCDTIGAKSNLDKMFNIVKKSGATLIAISNPTKKNSSKHKKWVEKTDEIGQHTEESSIPDHKIKVNSNLKDKKYFSDGYHLGTDSGQEWIYEQLKSILDKL